MFIRKAAYWSITWSIPVLLATQFIGVLVTMYSDEQHRMTVAAELMRVAATRIAARMEDVGKLEGLVYIPTNLTTYSVYVVDKQGIVVKSFDAGDVGVLGTREAWQRCVGRDLAAVVTDAKDRSTGATLVSAACSVRLAADQYYVVVDIAKSEIMTQSSGFYIDRWLTVAWLCMLSYLIMYFKPYLLLAKLPSVGESVQNAHTTLLSVIRSFPSTTCGVALVDDNDTIVECSVSFAKLLQAFGTKEIIGTKLSTYTGHSELVEQLMQTTGYELIERPAVVATTKNTPISLYLSIAKQPFGYVVVLRTADTPTTV